MTDSEKLDLLLEKVDSLDNRMDSLDNRMDSLDVKVTSLEKDMIDVKSDLNCLHRDNTFIIDEIERVHTILERHQNDKSVHSA